MTTITNIMKPNLSGMTDEDLATSIFALDLGIARQQEQRGYCEMVLTRRLQARNAVELAHPALEIKLSYPSPVYNVPMLASSLTEIIPPEDYDKAYRPAWTKEIWQPARFNGQALNSLARRYGAPVEQALEQAKLPSNPKLVVKPKETP